VAEIAGMTVRSGLGNTGRPGDCWENREEAGWRAAGLHSGRTLETEAKFRPQDSAHTGATICTIPRGMGWAACQIQRILPDGARVDGFIWAAVTFSGAANRHWKLNFARNRSASFFN
jgi:hypothetical protein